MTKYDFCQIEQIPKYTAHYGCLPKIAKNISFYDRTVTLQLPAKVGKGRQDYDIFPHLTLDDKLQEAFSIQNYHLRLSQDQNMWWNSTVYNRKEFGISPKQIILECVQADKFEIVNQIKDEMQKRGDCLEILFVIDQTCNLLNSRFTKLLKDYLDWAMDLIDKKFENIFIRSPAFQVNIADNWQGNAYLCWEDKDLAGALYAFILFATTDKDERCNLKAPSDALACSKQYLEKRNFKSSLRNIERCYKIFMEQNS